MITANGKQVNITACLSNFDYRFPNISHPFFIGISKVKYLNRDSVNFILIILISILYRGKQVQLTREHPVHKYRPDVARQSVCTA